MKRKRDFDQKENEGPATKRTKLHPLLQQARSSWKLERQALKINTGYAHTGDDTIELSFAKRRYDWKVMQVHANDKRNLATCPNCERSNLRIVLCYFPEHQLLGCSRCSFSKKSNTLESFFQSTSKSKSGDDSVSKFLRPYSDNVPLPSKEELNKMKKSFFFKFQTHNINIMNQSKISSLASSCKISSKNLMSYVLNQPTPVFSPQEFDQSRQLRILYDQVIESHIKIKTDVKINHDRDGKKFPHHFKDTLRPMPVVAKKTVKFHKILNTPLLSLLLNSANSLMPQSMLLVSQKIRAIVPCIEQVEDVLYDATNRHVRIKF